MDAGQPISGGCPHCYPHCQLAEDFGKVWVQYCCERITHTSVGACAGNARIDRCCFDIQNIVLCLLRSGAGSLVMMPIGVPKVAYRVPGAGSADWVDIYNRLYRERIIFLGQEIDDDYANQIIGVLLVSR